MQTDLMRRAALASIFGGAAILRAKSSTAPAKATATGELRDNPKALDAIEQLAKQILQEVSEARGSQAQAGVNVPEMGEDKSRAVGETRGVWRAMQPGEVPARSVGETRGMWSAMKPVRPY